MQPTGQAGAAQAALLAFVFCPRVPCPSSDTDPRIVLLVAAAPLPPSQQACRTVTCSHAWPTPACASAPEPATATAATRRPPARRSTPRRNCRSVAAGHTCRGAA